MFKSTLNKIYSFKKRTGDDEKKLQVCWSPPPKEKKERNKQKYRRKLFKSDV